MDNEMDLLSPENLPLDLGELGMVTEAELVMPGVYNAILEFLETGLAVEAFIVLSSAEEISAAAKRYGKTDPDYPNLLVYSEDETGNTRYIVGYELFRYKILRHLPLPEGETIRSISAAGAEMYPEYFGGYPVPFLTPWGCTTRHKIIANGLYWLETELCQRGLAVAYLKYDDGARSLAERFHDASVQADRDVPGYLFFTEANSSVPLFELVSVIPKEQLCYEVNRAALMNAVYQHFPEYAAQHNLAEQAGLNDGLGQFLHTQGIDVTLNGSPDRLIFLTAQAEEEYIDF